LQPIKVAMKTLLHIYYYIYIYIIVLTSI